MPGMFPISAYMKFANALTASNISQKSKPAQETFGSLHEPSGMLNIARKPVTENTSQNSSELIRREFGINSGEEPVQDSFS